MKSRFGNSSNHLIKCAAAFDPGAMAHGPSLGFAGFFSYSASTRQFAPVSSLSAVRESCFV